MGNRQRTPASAGEEISFYGFVATAGNNVKSHCNENPLFMEINRQFGRFVFRRTSAFGMEPFIKRVSFGGDTCLEIGSYNGITAVLLSQYFKQVISVDVVSQPLKFEIVKHLNLTNITFHDVQNNKEKADLINSLSFDAAYIDGNHENDTKLDFSLVKRCRNVLFHEYWFIQPPVYDLVNSLDHITHDDNWFAHWRPPA